jgi:hypothetical protein
MWVVSLLLRWVVCVTVANFLICVVCVDDCVYFICGSFVGFGCPLPAAVRGGARRCELWSEV